MPDMGTAPQATPSPAMPDVKRLVSRSVGMLRRLGMSEQEALLTVLSVTEVVRGRMVAEGLLDLSWVLAVNSEVFGRLRALPRPVIEYAGDEYGDRSSSGPGSPGDGERP